MPATAQLEALADRLQQIPTLPAIHERLRNMMSSPNTSAAQIGQVISNDQAISSRLLQLVNSSFYGFRQRVNNITLAITMIGFRGIEDLILTLSVMPCLAEDGAGAILDVRQFWCHSVATACCARAAAQMTRFAPRDEAFTAGLLHDIGKLALWRVMPDDYLAVVDVARERNEPIHVIEQEQLGFTHADVGRLLARKWNFPDDLGEVLAWHHAPEFARQQRRRVAMMHVLDIVVRGAVPSACAERIPVLDSAAWAECGLDRAQIEPLMRATCQEFEKGKAFLSILD